MEDINIKLEMAKNALINAENNRDVKDNPVIKGMIDCIKIIPGIGEGIDSSLDLLLNNTIERRRNELIEIINGEGLVTWEMVDNIEFVVNFAKVYDAVARLATNEKVVYFGNLIKRGYLEGDKIDNNVFDEYFNALNTLSYRQIDILIELYRHEESMKIFDMVEDEKRNDLQIRDAGWSSFRNTIIEKYDMTEDEFKGVLTGISKTGFCREITGAYFGYSGGMFAITDYCKKFVTLIF